MSELHQNRKFMHCPSFKGTMEESDQAKEIPHPPHFTPRTEDFITLPAFDDVISSPSYMDLLDNRRSERVYSDAAMTMEQLAFLLWSAQGIQKYRGKDQMATLRPAPSGGARHPFELYATVNNVDGLAPGIYRYAPTKHVGEKLVTIERIGALDDYETQISDMLVGQKWAAKAPVVLFISCIPYRAEWRYNKAAHRVMLIDLGHVGQNLMLSATALGLGSCCLAAFDQELCDKIFAFNSIDEYTVYAVSVGNLKS